MNFEELAVKLIELVGGRENINDYTHCMTRMRFMLNDFDLVKEEEIKALKGVKGIVKKGGQYQVIIGNEVDLLYNEIVKACPLTEEKEKSSTKKEKSNTFDNILGYVSGSITPVLPALIASGLISAVLALLSNFGIVTTDSPSYQLFNGLAGAALTYMPVLVAIAAAKRLKTNEYMAAFIMLALCTPAIDNVSELSLFGIPLLAVKYTNNIIPPLFMVPVLAAFDKYVVSKYTPSLVKTVLRPLILASVMFVITLFVLGPIGTLIGQLLANFALWVTSFGGGIAMAVVSVLHPLLVMVGLHLVLNPIIMAELGAVGYSTLIVKALAANLAIGGAALAVGFKAKKKENKEAGISTGITALLAVTEPALYGVLIRFKKPFFGALAGAGVAGLFAGIFELKAYAPAGLNLMTLPVFLGGTMENFYMAIVVAIIAIVSAFIFTWLLGFKED